MPLWFTSPGFRKIVPTLWTESPIYRGNLAPPLPEVSRPGLTIQHPTTGLFSHLSLLHSLYFSLYLSLRLSSHLTCKPLQPQQASRSELRRSAVFHHIFCQASCSGSTSPWNAVRVCSTREHKQNPLKAELLFQNLPQQREGQAEE